MISLLILAITQVSLLQASLGSCRSLKKISGSQNWISCFHSHMTNVGDGCGCKNGYEYRNGWCRWSGGLCCFNQGSIAFVGDVSHGKSIRFLDGCVEFKCDNGHMNMKRLVHRDSENNDVCDGVSAISIANTRNPECEKGYTKVLGYPWANDHKYPSGRADMTKKECADACNADHKCIAYTATGMCMATQERKTFADMETREKLNRLSAEHGFPVWVGINYCVKDRTTIATGANSCDWKHQIPRLTNYVSLDVCARQCADDAECKAFYLYKKNPFSKKPLCVGFSQTCTGQLFGAPRHAPFRTDLAEPCRDNEWCGYNVIKSDATAQILIKN